MGASPRETAHSGGRLPIEPGDRVRGYGVMGLPVGDGHYLALRHWTAVSFGEPYRSVWHRDPAGRWTIRADQPPRVSCARFVGAAADRVVTAPIDITWEDESHLEVHVAGLRWHIALRASLTTALLTACGAALPGAAWSSPTVLRLMGAMAGPLLGARPMQLVGTMPCGQRYRFGCRATWLVEDTAAELDGRGLETGTPPERTVTLGSLPLPGRGIFFADATGRFTTPTPTDHPGRQSGEPTTTGGAR